LWILEHGTGDYEDEEADGKWYKRDSCLFFEHEAEMIFRFQAERYDLGAEADRSGILRRVPYPYRKDEKALEQIGELIEEGEAL
jgi:hypothetical protein